MRLDQFLLDQKLARSRTQAQNLITDGRVTVDGMTARKAAQQISIHHIVSLEKRDPTHGADYVSRGAHKLIAGLNVFDINPENCICLDIGAGTGGFTEVLLRRGAAKIYAVDVGTGQLHQSLHARTLIVSLEQQNAKTLSRSLIPEKIDLIVADVSFISVIKAAAGPLDLCRQGAGLVFLIKPQFEMGRRFIGKGGRVTATPEEIDQMLTRIRHWLTQSGWHVLGLITSPILGGDGNREYLIGAIKQ